MTRKEFLKDITTTIFNTDIVILTDLVEADIVMMILSMRLILCFACYSATVALLTWLPHTTVILMASVSIGRLCFTSTCRI
jgi:hypothetical protein